MATMLESGRYKPEYTDQEEDRVFDPEQERKNAKDLMDEGYTEYHVDPDVLVLMPDSIAAEALRRAYALGHENPRFWVEPKDPNQRWKKREVRVTEGQPPKRFRRTGRPIDGLK